MFEDQNRIKRTELADDVQRDLLTQDDHDKLGGLVTNPDGDVSFKYSLDIDVNGKPFKYDGTKDVDITITPETVGAATFDHTHPAQVNITGNSGTTTKLKIPVNIGNASFDGTKDITLADMGVASDTHNHDTVYSKLDHDHDKSYSKLDHDHDKSYSKLDHTHLYAGSAKSGGPATTALKFDKDLTLEITGGLTGSVKFAGDEGSVSMEVELANHNHLLPDIDFSGYNLVLDPSGYELTSPEDPTIEGPGAIKSDFGYHLSADDTKYIIFGLQDIQTDSIEVPTIFEGGSIIQSINDGQSTLAQQLDHSLLIEYLNSNYEVIASQTIDDTTATQLIPAKTKYIKVISKYLSYLVYDDESIIVIESIDANNIPNTCTEFHIKNTPENILKHSGKLVSFSISTSSIYDWSDVFSPTIEDDYYILKSVELNLTCSKNLIFDRTFKNCKSLIDVNIYTNGGIIISAVEMFKSCHSLNLPPKSLSSNYIDILDMTEMYSDSGICRLMNFNNIDDLDAIIINENAKLDRMFAYCRNLSGSFVIALSTLVSEGPSGISNIKPITDIIKGTVNPISIAYYWHTLMVETDSINKNRKFIPLGGYIFHIDNTANPLNKFSFKISSRSTENLKIITSSVNDEGIATSIISTFALVTGESLYEVPIDTSTKYIILTDMTNSGFMLYNIESIQYTDFNGITKIEAVSGNISDNLTCFCKMKTDENQNPFTQSTGIVSFSLLSTNSITDMRNAFKDCVNLRHVDLYTRNTLYMDSMFENCTSLVRFPDLNTFNTISANKIFAGCEPSLLTDKRIIFTNEEGAFLPVTDHFFDSYTPIEISYLSNNIEVDKYVKANKDFVTGVIIDEWNVKQELSSSGGLSSEDPYCIDIDVDRSIPNSGNVLSFTSMPLLFPGCVKLYSFSLSDDTFVLSDTINITMDDITSIEIPSETDIIRICGDFENFEFESSNTLPISSLVIPKMPNLNSFTINKSAILLQSLRRVIIGENKAGDISELFSGNYEYKSLLRVDIYVGYTVTSTAHMFAMCHNLRSVDIYSPYNSITDMQSMFKDCSYLSSLTLAIDTSNVTNMSKMFYSCFNLAEIPGNLNTSKVIDMNYMFYRCVSLVSIPELDTSSVTNMSDMFNGCMELTTIPLLDTSKVTDMSRIFSDCIALINIPLLDTSNVTSMMGMFSGCELLVTIPLLDTSKVTNMQAMFNCCSSLASIPELDTSKVTNMKWMFDSCISLTSIPPLDTSKVTDMMCMFQICPLLASIPLLDTSKVTNMSSMFSECASLTTIPLLDTRNVIDMSGMFEHCGMLTSIPLLNTSKVTNMSEMFLYCESLTTIPLLDTRNVEFTNSMFVGCTNLTSVPMFNLISIFNISSMFAGCSSLTALDLYIASEKPIKDVKIIDLDKIIESSRTNPILINIFNTDNTASFVNDMITAYASNANIKINPLNAQDSIMLKIGAPTTIFAKINDKTTAANQLSISCMSVNKDASINHLEPVITTTGTAVDLSSVCTENTDFLIVSFLNRDTSSNARVNVASVNIGPDDAFKTLFPPETITEFTVLYFPSFSSSAMIRNNFQNIEKLSMYKHNITDMQYFLSVYSGSSIKFSYLKEVPYLETSMVTRMSGMFKLCNSLTHVNMTGNCKTINAMFLGCSSLAEIPSCINWDEVENTRDMFYHCISLTTASIPYSPKLAYLQNMFQACSNLIKIEYLDLRKANNINNMFGDCYNLKSVPSIIDAPVVNDAESVFVGCKALEKAPLIKLPLATKIRDIFAGCTSLRSIPSFDVPPSVNSLARVFQNCSSLVEAPMLNTSGITNLAYTFKGCISLQSVPLWDISNVTSTVGMFTDCSSLVTIPLFNTSKVTVMNYMFQGCKSLITIPFLDTSNVNSMYNMFEGCSSLRSDLLPVFDTSKVTVMLSMFKDCTSLVRALPFNTSNVVNTASMFEGCIALTNVSELDMSNVVYINNMFHNCSSLTELPLLNTSKATDMTNMFAGCASLTTIPLLDTSNVTNMTGMFKYCSRLTNIPLLDTSNVTNMTEMFYYCSSLVNTFDLNNEKCVEMYRMYGNCNLISGNIIITNKTTQFQDIVSNVIREIIITVPSNNTIILDKTDAEIITYSGGLDVIIIRGSDANASLAAVNDYVGDYVNS